MQKGKTEKRRGIHLVAAMNCRSDGADEDVVLKQRLLLNDFQPGKAHHDLEPA
jgi:hypothetical protein